MISLTHNSIAIKLDDVIVDENVERKRVLEFHSFMKGERESYNIGLNILDNIMQPFF